MSAQRQEKPVFNERELIEEFRSYMRVNGCDTDDDIVPGTYPKIMRCRVAGDKGQERSGWYWLHIDGIRPNGKFGNHKLGQNRDADGVKWLADIQQTGWTEEQRAAWVAEQKAKRAAQEAADKARWERQAVRAQAVWEAAAPAPADHPYLTRKGVQAHGLRVGSFPLCNRDGEPYDALEGVLLVPIRDRKGLIWSLQAILNEKNHNDVDKLFMGGARKAGLYYIIGQSGTGKILIGEGFATMATAHEETGHCSVVAFNSGNLEAVAATIHDVKPTDDIIVVADNDRWTTAGAVVNPGVTSAIKAAGRVRGLVAVPEFADIEGKPTDINDLRIRQGGAAVQACIESAVAPGSVPDPVAWIPPAARQPEAGVPAAPGAESANVVKMRKAKPPKREHKRLGCEHFEVLGHDGDHYYFFHKKKRQVIVYTKGDLSENGLIALAPLKWWEKKYTGERGGFNKKAAVDWLINDLLYEAPIYDPRKVRGRGAWQDGEHMIFHNGDFLIVDGEYMDVNEVREAINSRYIYELAHSLGDIEETALTAQEGARLIEIAQKFRWVKPASALLVAGYIALAPLCGAVEWRSHIWLTGGAGSGKSTVMNSFIHPLLGGRDLYAQGNSTEAGIRQNLKHDALPVLFDESETNTDKERIRMDQVLAMVRQSSTQSDAQTLKGTADGSGTDYTIRSMFCLASIQVGITQQADFERMAILSLKPKKDGDTREDDEWKNLKNTLYAEVLRDKSLAGRLFQRSLQLLPVTLDNIKIFADAGAQLFGSQREGDQYGTLMAGAWSLSHDRVATVEEARAWMAQYDWSDYLENSDSEESDKALGAFLEAHVRCDNGVTVTVYELARLAMGKDAHAALSGDAALAALERHGMLIEKGRLVLSNNSMKAGQLRKLMEKTTYASDLRNQFLRLGYLGVDKFDNRGMRFNGVASKCISFPLSLFASDSKGSVDF